MLRGYYGFEYEFPPENNENDRHPPPQQFSGSSSHCPYHHHHHYHAPPPPVAVVDDPVYGSDEFRMYGFKIKRCSRTRSHDWTECPFAHRGEKAQRRDPRKFDYCAVACPAFRNGHCAKGNACEFAHGVFEYWLHPGRYRTRACNAGRFCQRKVCFFAHTPDQLRAETRYRLHPAACRARVESEAAGRATTPPSPGMEYMKMGSPSLEGVSEFLKSLRSLKIRDESDDVSGFDLPEIEWVSDLVEANASV